MIFEITILGNNSAIFAHNRHPSAQVININHKLYLIDCGEATQLQLRKYHIKQNKINHIFISHLHGDHFFGLIGLINTFNLLNRNNPLHIFGSKILHEILNIQLKHTGAVLNYELVFHPINPEKNKLIHSDKNISVFTIPMLHNIPCCGFLFKEQKKNRKIIKEKTDVYNIPLSYLKELQKGHDYTDKKGRVIKNEILTTPPTLPRIYAACSDTTFNENIIQHIKNANLLYHEATFYGNTEEKASEYSHSTAKQAAIIAGKAKVKKLIIGHFSAKYKDLAPLLDEAKKEFPETYLAIEGETFSVESENDN